MTRHRVILLILATLLVAINAWRWLGASPAASTHPRPGTTVTRASDLALTTSTREAPGATGKSRDLFRWRAASQPAVRPVAATRPLPVVPVAALPPEAGPPPKTAQQLAEEAAQADLAQFRLAGVVVRNNRSEAYLIKGEQIHLVRRGDRVGDRFTVEALDADRIVLADPATHVRGTLQVAGK